MRHRVASFGKQLVYTRTRHPTYRNKFLECRNQNKYNQKCPRAARKHTPVLNVMNMLPRTPRLYNVPFVSFGSTSTVPRCLMSSTKRSAIKPELLVTFGSASAANHPAWYLNNNCSTWTRGSQLWRRRVRKRTRS